MKPNPLPLNQRERSLITKIHIFVLRNIDKNFSVKHIAGRVGVAPNFIRKRFPEACNYTVIEYRRKYRLIKAAKKIAKGTPVKVAAKEAKYQTSWDFLRAFKNKFQVTPLEYIHHRIQMRKK